MEGEARDLLSFTHCSGIGSNLSEDQRIEPVSI